jgi:hypothetical protein
MVELRMNPARNWSLRDFVWIPVSVLVLILLGIRDFQ